MANRRNPLGGNPISPVDPDEAVRQMVRGDNEEDSASHQGEREKKEFGPGNPEKTTVTPGGFLRKTVYFEEPEWQAIRARAYQEEKNYSDIVRRAVRRELGLANDV